MVVRHELGDHHPRLLVDPPAVKHRVERRAGLGGPESERKVKIVRFGAKGSNVALRVGKRRSRFGLAVGHVPQEKCRLRRGGE